MIAGGLNEFFRWRISNLIACILLKRAREVSTILTKEYLNNARASSFFLKAAWPAWVSFLLITIPNQKKRTRIKKKYFVGKTANDWILTLQVTGAIIRLPLVFFFDVMIMTDNYVDNHHQNRYNYFYHTHLEIIGDPCKLLGPHWCDEITNCTLFCS